MAILFIDDDETGRAVAGFNLRKAGLEVDEAPEAFAGRDVCEDSLPPKDIFGAFGYGDEGAYMYEALFRGPECPRRICIRSGPHRLDLSIRRNGRSLEGDDQDVFYCHTRQDPDERRNAAHDPVHADTINELRARLLDWHDSTHTEAIL